MIPEYAKNSEAQMWKTSLGNISLQRASVYVFIFQLFKEEQYRGELLKSVGISSQQNGLEKSSACALHHLSFSNLLPGPSSSPVPLWTVWRWRNERMSEWIPTPPPPHTPLHSHLVPLSVTLQVVQYKLGRNILGHNCPFRNTFLVSWLISQLYIFFNTEVQTYI